jgi:hypothetical protein
VSFQPILFLFLWSAALRITISDALPPIQFEVLLDPHGVQIWTITALICPPLAMLPGGWSPTAAYPELRWPDYGCDWAPTWDSSPWC